MNNLVDIEDYTKRLTEELKMKFGKRLLYALFDKHYITFDHDGKIKDGAWVGITGENIDIADDI